MGGTVTLRPKLMIFCGLPGSGKSTVARQLERETGALPLNVDDWVAALGVDFWDDEFRHKLERRLYKHFLKLLELGQSVILEDGSWKRDERDELRRTARNLGAIAEIHYFDYPFDELAPASSAKCGCRTWHRSHHSGSTSGLPATIRATRCSGTRAFRPNRHIHVENCCRWFLPEAGRKPYRSGRGLPRIRSPEPVAAASRPTVSTSSHPAELPSTRSTLQTVAGMDQVDRHVSDGGVQDLLKLVAVGSAPDADG